MDIYMVAKKISENNDRNGISKLLKIRWPQLCGWFGSFLKHGGWLYLQQTGSRHLSTHNRDVSPRPDCLSKSETPTI